jgi:demethoxyubiquinone hydroxylase (CLK1/Coq7/Cat5 family)
MATTNYEKQVDKSVDQLNSFLRGELSAVQTYNIALEKLTQSPIRAQLETCQMSHARRVVTLRERIAARGGKPADSSGPWGVFAKAVEQVGAVLGEKTAIAALEEGEDHGLHDYKDDLDKLDAETRQIVVVELLPEQERTHRTMSQIKHQFDKH